MRPRSGRVPPADLAQLLHAPPCGHLPRGVAARVHTLKKPSTVVAAILGALVVLLIIIPAAVSLSNSDGAICFADSACPLSAVNPCVRKPTFAVVGRCTVAIRRAARTAVVVKSRADGPPALGR